MVKGGCAHPEKDGNVRKDPGTQNIETIARTDTRE